MKSTGEIALSGSILEMAAIQLNAERHYLTANRLTGDASTRSYFRVKAAGSSIIVALYANAFDEAERSNDRLTRLERTNPSARLTFANDPCAHIEVTNLFLQAGLPVPRIVAASGTQQALLIEDVGDIRLQDWVLTKSPTDIEAAYRRAVELIVLIQEATELAVHSDSICSKLAFDELKLKWELGFFFANYFNRHLGLRLDAATANAVQEDFKSICAELAARPRVLVQRDFHARNLMMRDDQIFIIDHQDARMGPVSYDLASLLGDPYAALDARIVSEMVDYFVRLKAGSTAPLGDANEFRMELELMMLQRMLKAIGTYASQAVSGNPIYVDYIRPALESALRSMKSLGRFDQTRALLERTTR